MKKVITFVALVLLLALGATPVYANEVPALPHAFYGSLTINGGPAPVGTRVEARGEGVATGISGNPTTTTVSGIYGTSNPYQPRLVVQGDNIREDTTLTFYVKGYSTGQTAEWHSGEVTELPLSVTIPVAPSVGDGGAPRFYVETTLFGIEARFLIDSDGKILKTIEATSADGMLAITISKGTIALDKDGKRLKSLQIAIDETPPDPPENANIIGLPYIFSPDGATFDPSITFTWTFDPQDLPEGVDPEDLVLAYYDEEAGEWVELDCVVDTENNTITASVEHFTTFAIIGTVTPPPALAAFSVSSLTIKPAEVQPNEIVTITVSVANTRDTWGIYSLVLKINGVKEAEKQATVDAASSQDVSFSVTREEPGSYTVFINGLSGSFTVAALPAPPEVPPPVVPPEVKPPFNWPLVGGIIAAVVVVGLLIYFLVVRRRRAY